MYLCEVNWTQSDIVYAALAVLKPHGGVPMPSAVEPSPSEQMEEEVPMESLEDIVVKVQKSSCSDMF